MKRLVAMAGLLLGLATEASAAYTHGNYAIEGTAFTQTDDDPFRLRMQGLESSPGG